MSIILIFFSSPIVSEVQIFFFFGIFMDHSGFLSELPIFHFFYFFIDLKIFIMGSKCHVFKKPMK